MVPLVSPRTAFEAKVVVARLGAEGIVWDLRGGIDGVYPVGTVEVLVAEEDVERARELLLVDEVEAAFEGVDPGEDDHRTELLLGVALVLLVVLVLTVRVLTI
jgi:hypothetical protein